MPSMRPANEAPIAGASGEVSVAAVRGFRARNGAAEGSSRWARKRVKNRKSNRYRRRIDERDRESRKVSDLWNGCFLPEFTLSKSQYHDRHWSEPGRHVLSICSSLQLLGYNSVELHEGAGRKKYADGVSHGAHIVIVASAGRSALFGIFPCGSAVPIDQFFNSTDGRGGAFEES